MAFPSPLERSVASSLILLSKAKPPPLALSPPILLDYYSGWHVESERRSACNEKSIIKSSVSSSTNINRLYEQTGTPGSGGLDVFSHCQEVMKFNVCRGKRSRVSWSSEEQKVSGSKPKSVSCLSCTSSTTDSCAGTCCPKSNSTKPGPLKKQKVMRIMKRSFSSYGSTKMISQADAILQLLSCGRFHEWRIRQMLGDSPDTSKALRMLLKLEEIRRQGTGGRVDPYIYTIAK